MFLPGNAVDQGESDQVGQMAHRCISRIMRLRRHFDDVATQCGPDINRLLQLNREGALDGRQDDLLARVQVRVGVLDT